MPDSMADLGVPLGQRYDPIHDLRAPNPIDRYAAVKALPSRDDLRGLVVPALEELLRDEPEERVALEAAGASAAMGSALGQDRIGQILWGEGRNDFRMEAVLILTELASAFAREELIRVVGDEAFERNEIRQAAVWGLGKAGLRAYDQIVPFIDHQDENLAAHAIVAFGSDTPEPVIRALAQALIEGKPRRAAAASEAIRLIGSETALKVLIEAADTRSEWVIATLGRLPTEMVRPAVAGTDLMLRVAPVLLLGEGANWLAMEDRVMDIAFLSKQDLLGQKFSC
jgi:HEAT repeat protein